jgi:hypothetical protein
MNLAPVAPMALLDQPDGLGRSRPDRKYEPRRTDAILPAFSDLTTCRTVDAASAVVVP